MNRAVRKRFIMSGMILVGLLLMAVVIAGVYFHRTISNYNANQGQSFLQKEREEGRFNDRRFVELRKEQVTLRSPHGYALLGTLLWPTDSVLQGVVVLHHGITVDRWTMMKYADLYLDIGFACLMYDMRNHGQSGGENVSYGVFEKYDLQKAVEYARKRFPKVPVGVHGESFGAATTIQHAALNEQQRIVDFYVADCGYSDLHALFKTRLKADYNIPNLGILGITSLMTRWKDDYLIKEVRPVEDIRHVHTPMLIVHGENDHFVPTYMANDLFQAKPEPKELLLVPEAGHAKALLTDRHAYQQTLYRFLQQHLSLQLPGDTLTNN